MMPPWWRRAWCRLFGHRWSDGGMNDQAEAGVMSFACCRVCGKWGR